LVKTTNEEWWWFFNMANCSHFITDFWPILGLNEENIISVQRNSLQPKTRSHYLFSVIHYNPKQGVTNHQIYSMLKMYICLQHVFCALCVISKYMDHIHVIRVASTSTGASMQEKGFKTIPSSKRQQLIMLWSILRGQSHNFIVFFLK